MNLFHAATISQRDRSQQTVFDDRRSRRLLSDDDAFLLGKTRHLLVEITTSDDPAPIRKSAVVGPRISIIMSSPA